MSGWASRTHCIHGHELAGDNVLMVSGSKGMERRCRACNRRRNRQYQARLREERRTASQAPVTEEDLLDEGEVSPG